MRIDFIGTGNVFSNRLSPCILIDESVLIEVPNGAVKALLRYGVDFSKISTCMITHIHGDHIWDLPFLVLQKNICSGKKITFVGPKGVFEYIKHMCTVAYSTLNWDALFQNSIEQVIEVAGEMREIKLDHYNVWALRMQHGDALSYGYCLEDERKKRFVILEIQNIVMKSSS